MIGPSSSGAGRAQRNRWISPRQVHLLDALWSARLRRAGRRPRPERSREERLRHFAEIVGHAVGSCRELSWREANRVLHRLLEEVRTSGPAPGRSAGKEPDPSSRTDERSAAGARKRSTAHEGKSHAGKAPEVARKIGALQQEL